MAFQTIQGLAAATCLCICTAEAQAAAPVYRLTLVPPVNGVTECHMASLNDAAQVAGTCYHGGGAFLWSAATGSQPIVDPARPEGVLMVRALNNLGQVAGTRYWSDVSEPYERGFVWDPVNGMSYFGGSDRYWHVKGLNDGTVVAGFRAPMSGDYDWKAYLWTAADGVRKLRPYAHRVSAAYDINNGGQAVGTLFDELTSKSSSVIFEPDGTLTRIPLPGHKWGAPNAINGAGHVTGQMRASSGADHAFLWIPDAGVLDIDPRPLRTDYSRGMDLNDAGQVVGTFSGWVDGVPTGTVFYWDASNGMLDLVTLIDPNDPLLAHIEALRAYSDDPVKINNRGQIAVTARMLDGSILPLLLTPVP